jgi:hypothetical protein
MALMTIDSVAALEESIELLEIEARLADVLPNRFHTLSDPLLEVLDLEADEAVEHDEVMSIIAQLLEHMPSGASPLTCELMLEVYEETLRTVVAQVAH